MQTNSNKWLFVIPLALTLVACQKDAMPGIDTASPLPVIGRIERVDPRFDAIVPDDAVLEILAEGHEWTEGPVWVPQLQSVLYSDIPNNAIHRWRDGAGASLWLQPAGDTADVTAGGQGGSNGLLLDRAGRLVLAQHGDRRIARLATGLDAPAPRFDTLIERFEGRRLNSPNDLAMRHNGDIYFTDPPYGLAQGDDDAAKELDTNGVYRLAADGSVSLLVSDLTRPNGIAFAPDQSVLYVANSDRAHPAIMAYDVDADGGLGRGRLFYESWGDGMAVDRHGNLYVAGPGNGVIVLTSAGDLLGSFNTTQATSNCTFGDDESTLYITSDMYLLRVRLKEQGSNRS